MAPAGRLHAGVVSGKTACRSLANSRQQVVEAHIRQAGNRPLLVEAPRVCYKFDAKRYLEAGRAAGAMAIAFNRAQVGQTGRNVVDLGPRLRDRQWNQVGTCFSGSPMMSPA